MGPGKLIEVSYIRTFYRQIVGYLNARGVNAMHHGRRET